MTGVVDPTRRRKLVCGGSHMAGRTSSQMAHPAGRSGLPRCAHGARHLDGGRHTTLLDTQPGPKVRGGRMAFHRIVVPVDGAGRSDDALAVPVRAADPLQGRLRLVHVRTWQPPLPPSREDGFVPTTDQELFTETPEQAARVIDTALGAIRPARMVADGIVVEAPGSMVAWAIVGTAAVWGADAIVVGRRPKRTLGFLLRGSVCEQVLRYSSCPVLVVGPRSA